ncbi:cellulase family glycosylhydrolase [Echinicola vietnamensis]|uniref:Endoglucanase n=1 Tax=Echinicola vietnamensis (strain DSM 17526 / LMG 23754 / KMM 6221) TaxID=926556 RepID=L0FU56_ECHVK|nr:cellulase family glycosylhydrolase [Echinicola vietnamensis]AGA77434.1 endoglucanase [Echinicola vietnamensis DSM 17526]
MHQNNRVVSLIFLFLLLGMEWACKSSEEEPSKLDVSSTRIELEADGESKEVSISSNTAWSAHASANWINMTPSSGTGSQTVSIAALANTTPDSREAVVQIVAGSLQREIQVSQAAGKSHPSYYIPADQTEMREISSLELAPELGIGWNLGNSLEAIGGETAWGNPAVTKELIDAVKAAGFSAVRIPVAWSKFTDESSFTIDPAWAERVEEVVNYVLDNDLYAIINIHWDGGWMQPTYVAEDAVNARLEAMWVQIALHFRDYDDHLLFAGTNEVMVDGDYGQPTPEYRTVQNGYNQTFVNAVRGTGGRNAYRHLVVQSFNTNIDHAVDFMEMPVDEVKDRLMAEVHYYDPYEFALDADSPVSEWGANADNPSKTAGWGGEAYATGQFKKMKSHFVDKGIPVIVGEYGAISKTNLEDHAVYRAYYLEWITQAMLDQSLVPFYWDNGHTGNHGFGLFDRNNGEQVYPDLIDKITPSIN